MSTSLTPQQTEALQKFQAFAQQQQKEIPTLTDDAGRTYGRDVIARLAGQISQNLDTSKISGGAFGVNVGDDTQIGFSAAEAKKLLGRTPTAPEMVILDMARQLSLQGISDISDLKKYKPTEVTEVSEGEGSPVDNIVTKYIDPETQKEFSPGFGSTYAGKGGTHYGYDEKTGKFYTVGQDTSDAGKIMPLLMMATLPFGGVGGLLSGATSSLAGALGGGALANIGANALVSGAVQGGIGSLTGQGFGKGFRSGALSGGIGAGVNQLGQYTGLDKGLGSLYTPAKSLVTSGLTSAALGQPFDLSEAAKNAAMKFGLNKALASTDLAPDQAKAMGAFLEFLGRKV
ncbi:hypothetical protein EB118_15275 [bacterium]|nr:hypothetical protein [bacterium]